MTSERLPDRFTGDHEVEQAWRAQSTEEPGAAVDAAIRAAARHGQRRRSTWQRYAPLAAAASVGVLALLLVRQSPPIDVPRRESLPAPMAPDAPATPPRAPATPPEEQHTREREAPVKHETKPLARTPAASTRTHSTRADPIPAGSPPSAAAPSATSTSAAAELPPAAERQEVEASDITGRGAQADSPTTFARTAARRSTANPSIRGALIARVKEDAAKNTNVRPSDVRVLSVEAVIWPDRRLGCEETGDRAADEPIPGFRIEVDAGGARMQYHTDESERVCIRTRP